MWGGYCHIEKLNVVTTSLLGLKLHLKGSFVLAHQSLPNFPGKRLEDGNISTFSPRSQVFKINTFNKQKDINLFRYREVPRQQSPMRLLYAMPWMTWTTMMRSHHLARPLHSSWKIHVVLKQNPLRSWGKLDVNLGLRHQQATSLWEVCPPWS